MNWELIKKHKLFIFCLIVVTVLLFKNLGNIYFWSDEAYSAVCAKNTTLFGYPKSFDGRNIAQHYWKADGEWKFTPFNRTTPWLHLYMGAMGFLFFGYTTFAARFFFVIAGIATLFVYYLFMRKYEKDPFIVNTALIILTCCVPFLLHMRQCRYYGPSILFGLLAAWGYLEFHREGKKPFFIISTVLLAYSLQSAIAVFVFSVIAHALLRFDKKRFKELIICGLWVGLFTLPHYIQLRLWERPDDLTNWEKGFRPGRYLSHFISYNICINDYLFPLVLVAVCLVWGWRKGCFTKEAFREREHVTFLTVYSVVNIIFLSVVAPHHFRLMSSHVPEICILGAYVIHFFRRQTGKGAAIGLTALICSTNFLHVLPYQIHKLPYIHEAFKEPVKKAFHWDIWGWSLWKMSVHAPLRSFQYEYLYEITHDYDGPIEGIARYINEHAGPDDFIKMPYGDYAIQFYTNRLVIPRGEIKNDIIPDWLILRGDYWKTRRQDPPLDEYFAPLIEREFEKIVLDYPEINWENQPEPEYHKFKTVEIDHDRVPPVVIYRRKQPCPDPSREERLRIINDLWEEKTY